MSTPEQHPIEYLFNERKKLHQINIEMSFQYPEMIAKPLFSPGGSGLWLG